MTAYVRTESRSFYLGIHPLLTVEKSIALRMPGAGILSVTARFRHLSKLCRNKRIKFYVRRRRVLTGGRLWAVLALVSLAFFLVAFSLGKITSSHGSRWDISWTAVAWLAVVCSFSPEVCAIDQLLEPPAGMLLLLFNKRNTVMG